MATQKRPRELSEFIQSLKKKPLIPGESTGTIHECAGWRFLRTKKCWIVLGMYENTPVANRAPAISGFKKWREKLLAQPVATVGLFKGHLFVKTGAHEIEYLRPYSGARTRIGFDAITIAPKKRSKKRKTRQKKQARRV